MCFAPTFLGVFFVYNGFVEGNSVRQIGTRLRTGYTDTLIANYELWPIVQLFNFGFVPLNYQALVVNSVALGWNTFIAHKQSQLSLLVKDSQ